MDNNQVALQYAMGDGSPANGKFPENPNGSLFDIAGICDPAGRVFGLMPHPEGFLHPTNHPHWTRYKEQAKRQNLPFDIHGLTPGVRMFQNAVEFIRQT
jgi:phosphoribosylformylglycinamidine synthase